MAELVEVPSIEKACSLDSSPSILTKRSSHLLECRPSTSLKRSKTFSNLTTISLNEDDAFSDIVESYYIKAKSSLSDMVITLAPPLIQCESVASSEGTISSTISNCQSASIDGGSCVSNGFSEFKDSDSSESDFESNIFDDEADTDAISVF